MHTSGQSNGTPAAQPQACGLRLRDIITPNPVVIRPDAPLADAARKMKLFDVGMLPVHDGQRLVGSVTDRDITVRATAGGRDPKSTCVREVMTMGIVCCFEDQTIEEAADLMEEKQIRRLPVLDGARRLVGIVSLGDLAVRIGQERLAGDVLGRISEPAAPSRGPKRKR